MAGLSGALLLGAQLTANYWTWAYLPWAFPCIAVALLLPGAHFKPAEPLGRLLGHRDVSDVRASRAP
jgi:hypothetical protein